MIFHLIVMIVWSSGVNLEQFGGHFGAPWAHFEVTLAEVGAKLGLSWPNLAPSSGPNGAINKLYTFPRHILLVKCRATPNGDVQGEGLGPPGRDIGRGKPLLRRRKGKLEDQYV